jgi:hypothetical protein
MEESKEWGTWWLCTPKRREGEKGGSTRRYRAVERRGLGAVAWRVLDRGGGRVLSAGRT